MVQLGQKNMEKEIQKKMQRCKLVHVGTVTEIVVWILEEGI